MNKVAEIQRNLRERALAAKAAAVKEKTRRVASYKKKRPSPTPPRTVAPDDKPAVGIVHPVVAEIERQKEKQASIDTVSAQQIRSERIQQMKKDISSYAQAARTIDPQMKYKTESGEIVSGAEVRKQMGRQAAVYAADVLRSVPIRSLTKVYVKSDAGYYPVSRRERFIIEHAGADEKRAIKKAYSSGDVDAVSSAYLKGHESLPADKKNIYAYMSTPWEGIPVSERKYHPGAETYFAGLSRGQRSELIREYEKDLDDRFSVGATYKGEPLPRWSERIQGEAKVWTATKDSPGVTIAEARDAVIWKELTTPYAAMDWYKKLSPGRQYGISMEEGLTMGAFAPVTLAQMGVKFLFKRDKPLLLPDVAEHIGRWSVAPPDIVGSAISEVWLNKPVPSEMKKYQSEYLGPSLFKSIASFTGASASFKSIAAVGKFSAPYVAGGLQKSIQGAVRLSDMKRVVPVDPGSGVRISAVYRVFPSVPKSVSQSVVVKNVVAWSKGYKPVSLQYGFVDKVKTVSGLRTQVMRFTPVREWGFAKREFISPRMYDSIVKQMRTGGDVSFVVKGGQGTHPYFQVVGDFQRYSVGRFGGLQQKYISGFIKQDIGKNLTVVGRKGGGYGSMYRVGPRAPMVETGSPFGVKPYLYQVGEWKAQGYVSGFTKFIKDTSAQFSATLQKTKGSLTPGMFKSSLGKELYTGYYPVFKSGVSSVADVMGGGMVLSQPVRSDFRKDVFNVSLPVQKQFKDMFSEGLSVQSQRIAQVNVSALELGQVSMQSQQQRQQQKQKQVMKQVLKQKYLLKTPVVKMNFRVGSGYTPSYFKVKPPFSLDVDDDDVKRKRKYKKTFDGMGVGYRYRRWSVPTLKDLLGGV